MPSRKWTTSSISRRIGTIAAARLVEVVREELAAVLGRLGLDHPPRHPPQLGRAADAVADLDPVGVAGDVPAEDRRRPQHQVAVEGFGRWISASSCGPAPLRRCRRFALAHGQPRLGQRALDPADRRRDDRAVEPVADLLAVVEPRALQQPGQEHRPRRVAHGVSGALVSQFMPGSSLCRSPAARPSAGRPSAATARRSCRPRR
jgi:hypothetical protein